MKWGNSPHILKPFKRNPFTKHIPLYKSNRYARELKRQVTGQGPNGGAPRLGWLLGKKTGLVLGLASPHIL